MKFILMIAVTGLISCTALQGAMSWRPPTKEELALANYGVPILQQEAEQQTRVFLQSYLKDSSSALIQFSPIKKGWTGYYNEPISRFGYVLKASINAKNSYGGYTGYQQHEFCFLNGIISQCLPATGAIE